MTHTVVISDTDIRGSKQ